MRHLPRDEVVVQETWWESIEIMLDPMRTYLSVGPIRRYLAEALGSFMFAFVFFCNFHSRTLPDWYSVSVGCIMFCLTYILAEASGAHFNPAISLAVFLSGRGTWHGVYVYSILHLVSSMLAALAAHFMFADGSGESLPPVGSAHGSTYSVYGIGIIEMFYTAFLCFVFLNVTVCRKNNSFGNPNRSFALAVSLAWVGGISSARGVSGGVLNPAVSLTWAVFDFFAGHATALRVLCYLVSQSVGAIIGALLYRLVRKAERLDEEQFVNFQPTFVEMGLCEGLGTLFLTVTLGIHSFSSTKEGGYMAYASVLVAMIYAVADVSGGYFNPTVTVTAWLSGRGKISGTLAASYIALQCTFAIVGGFLYVLAISGHTTSLWKASGAADGFVAVFVEGGFAFLLSYAVLVALTAKNNGRTDWRDLFGLTVGGVTLVASVSVQQLSGGVVNPAVGLGISFARIVEGGHFWPCLAYAVLQIVGSLIAMWCFSWSHSAMGGALTKSESSARSPLSILSPIVKDTDSSEHSSFAA